MLGNSGLVRAAQGWVAFLSLLMGAPCVRVRVRSRHLCGKGDCQGVLSSV